MTGEKATGEIEQDAQKRPNDSRIDQELERPSPPFLSEGPEMVRDSHC